MQVRNIVIGSGLAIAVAVGLYACSDSEPDRPEPEAAPVEEVDVGAPGPALVMVQAQFVTSPEGKLQPGPAKAVLYRRGPSGWTPEVIEDPDSNVWHKGLPWRDGLLTIGAQRALLKHWTKGADGTWASRTLWESSFGGKFDRLRDIEIGDVDGDGADEMVIATHDMGVVAVGDEQADGTWAFQEFDKTPDTFVHEVEIGDVDGDGTPEFYVTPSARNKASGVSQAGGVVRYDLQDDGTYQRTSVVAWSDTHAKEILIADVDGTGGPELYAVKEGVVTKQDGKKVLEAPTQIVRLVPGNGAYTEQVVASLPDEHQSRFLVAGDVDGDGTTDLVAAGYKTGLWWLPGGAGEAQLVSKDSGGFEHATHVADLDGNGTLEIYAASEQKQFRLLRRFEWNGTGWSKEVVAPIPEKHITWNLQSATL